MRAVVQRVTKASVTVNGEIIGKIGKGLLILIGFGREDKKEDFNYIIDKFLNLRIFNDAEGKMNLSVRDINGEVLTVSQFTLYGDARKGRRPSYIGAASPEEARNLYDKFIDILKNKYNRVETGVFQADMNIGLINSGPVTILLDSKKSF